jgi:regulator of sigma E protease
MSSILHWALPVIGIGFVIFVHELGHYLAARATGVRVEAFSIGFGPRIFGFRRGPTDWKICLIPLGGFVKMAGEAPGAPKTGARDEFSSKSVARRSLIISAGVIMNLVFAFVAIPVAFMLGVPFEAPVIGSVEIGRPAWRAGLRAGDRVLSVDGRRTLGYEDVVTAIAIGDDVVSMVLDRDGARLSLDVPTELDRRRGLPTIGIGAAFAPIVVRPEDVDAAAADEEVREAAAHRSAAGLRAGDVIETIDGVGVSEIALLGDGAEPKTRLLGVRRGTALETIVLPPLLTGDQEGAPELFGVAPANATVAEVRPGTPAAALGLAPADRVAAVGGRDVLSYGEIVTALAGPRLEPSVTVERGGAVVTLAADLADPRVRASLRTDVIYRAAGRRVVPLDGGAAAAAGLRRGDEVVLANGAPVERFEDILKISTDAAVATVTFGIERDGPQGDAPLPVTVSRAKVPLNRALAGLDRPLLRTTVRAGFTESLRVGFDYTVMMTARVFMTLKSLFSRRVSAEHLGGIITIFRQSHETSKIAFSRGLLFMAVISINLAVLNVLPVPVLDGGWLLLLLIEKLRGRPVSERVLGVASWIGLGLILALMLFATWNDIKRL